MLIYPLASSSEGNCYIISDGTTILMIECGIPVGRVTKKINLANIDAILITHEHKDHCGYLKQFIKSKQVYATAGTFESKEDEIGLYVYHRNVIEKNKWFTIGSLQIYAFETQHDAKEPVGYFIHSTTNSENLLFATDTFYIKPRFEGINYLMIEANYDVKILEENIKEGKIPSSLRKRLIHSHFEISNVIKFIQANDMSQLKDVYLMHLSSGNSNEADFYNRVKEVVGKDVNVYVCAK